MGSLIRMQVQGEEDYSQVFSISRNHFTVDTLKTSKIQYISKVHYYFCFTMTALFRPGLPVILYWSMCLLKCLYVLSKAPYTVLVVFSFNSAID